MNFKIIKEILGLTFKIYLYCKEHRMLSLVKTGIMLMIFYMCFTEFYLKNRYFQDAKRTNIIKEKMVNIVKECGVNSFATWSTIEDSKANINKKKVIINDVIKCGIDDCPTDAKFTNPAYSNKYYLGYDDYAYLNELSSGIVIECSVLNQELNCPEYTPNTLKDIIKLLRMDITRISYVVVKDWKTNLVYVFTLSFAKNSINTCSSTGGNLLLDNLASTAMENL